MNKDIILKALRGQIEHNKKKLLVLQQEIDQAQHEIDKLANEK